MQKRTLKVAILAVLAIVLVLGIATAALADTTWKDLPDTVTAKYGLTDNQVAGISEGFANGLWQPYQPVTRAQFTKMAVAAFNIPLADPATASFSDVPKGSYYYQYVEGAKAAGAVNGTTATTFSLNANITRQQAVAIVARYIAKAQGYDLATMYTADEQAAMLKHFGDSASISADLKNEVAFAFDMGLTTGDDYGNFNPLANLTRIQGAAFLIRAQALIPPNLWIPAKIEEISADKTEGLIGQTYSVTFQVTTAEGHPAIGVLVDFDTLSAENYYVGNVQPEAAVTNNYGQVTVNMLSLEPGTQRLSATVRGVGTIYTTRYWLALDEVYDTLGATAQNNAGTEHSWAVRVVVFGPGPRSTSLSDWYNAIDIADTFNPADVNVADGIDANDDPGYSWALFGDGWTYADELTLTSYGYAPRTMAGINVEWSIYNIVDDPKTTLTNEAVTSVGNITAVDGTAITPAKTAVGKTDANGLSTIKIYSEATGTTLTMAAANYAQNPYPKELFNHGTFQQSDWYHNFDWDDQPTSQAYQTKTWIAHTFGTTNGPISPAYVAPNVGEEKTLTLTLTDVYGNPVAGRAVEWYMQGVGFFNTDDSGDTSDPAVAANNHDYDVTNAAGKATVFVKSYDAGEQIVHAKVRDKGTGGAEGTWTDYSAEVQWFDVNIATFDDITTQWGWSTAYTDTRYWTYQNEALSTNAVNGSHTFTLNVYGLKLEYDPSVDYADGQTPFIDSDAAGHSYDNVFDAKDAAYFGGILMVPQPGGERGNQTVWQAWMTGKLITPFGYTPSTKDIPTGFQDTAKTIPYFGLPCDYDNDGIIEAKDAFGIDERGYLEILVAGHWLQLSFEGAYTQYDYNDDAYPEAFEGVPGIYLPLAGKTVTFSKANSDGAGYSNLGTASAPEGDINEMPPAFTVPETNDLNDTVNGWGFLNNFYGVKTTGVGTFTAATATTDASGKATVTVSSTAKGPETIKAVVDWAGNPHSGNELVSAYAKKLWVAGTVAAASDVTIEIWIDGVLVATNKAGELAEPDKAAYTVAGSDGTLPDGTPYLKGDLILNHAHVEVHVKDAYGNDLPDYEVVYLLENIDGWLGGSQGASHTYIPFAYLRDYDVNNDTLDSLGTQYDSNGAAPDSDEPTPASDPYAYMVGDGGTDAFFFNQWLGSEKPVYEGHAGLPTWYAKVSGMQFLGYVGDKDHVTYTYTWQRWPGYTDPDLYLNGFDGILEDGGSDEAATAPQDIYLATDGAKAWTRDGYFIPEDGTEVIPNLLTGSNVDIQLADNVTGYDLPDNTNHAESILRVMVYAPADGLVQEGDYIWSTQVHQSWEAPVATTITLAPATDYAVTGLETETLVATVKDQFGTIMPGVEVTFASVEEDTADDSGYVQGGPLEGTLHETADDLTATTDENGNAAITWGATNVVGDWGVEKVYAYIDANGNSTLDFNDINGDGNWDSAIENATEVVSNAALIQWAYDDVNDNYVSANNGEQKVTVFADILNTQGWNGDTFRVYENPGGNVAGSLGSATYACAVDNEISTNLKQWYTGESFWVNDASSTNDDGVINWIYSVVN